MLTDDDDADAAMLPNLLYVLWLCAGANDNRSTRKSSVT